jgi:hypothetical protein
MWGGVEGVQGQTRRSFGVLIYRSASYRQPSKYHTESALNDILAKAQIPIRGTLQNAIGMLQKWS